MSRRSRRISEYLENSLKSYFGEKKGKELAKILYKTGVRCFDDLSMDIPEEVLQLADVDKESFRRFLEEYGPQAIVRLKEELSLLAKRLSDAEYQLKWAKEKLTSEVMRKDSLERRDALRELILSANMVGSLIESVQLCCSPYDYVPKDRARTYSEFLREILDKLLRVKKQLPEVSSELEGLIGGTEKIIEFLENEITGENLEILLSYMLSALSDIRRYLGEGSLDNKLIILENIRLKNKLISLICRIS